MRYMNNEAAFYGFPLKGNGLQSIIEGDERGKDGEEGNEAEKQFQSV